MLIEMLKKNSSFQSLTVDQQEIFARLADEFIDDNSHLYQDPKELVASTGVGTTQLWDSFLRMTPVEDYIKTQMAQITAIAQRKAMMKLQIAAEQGNVQAMKEINELSGIMDKSENSRIVIMHQVARPTNPLTQQQNQPLEGAVQ